MKNYQFRPGWAASLAVAALLPLFVSLGFWQLHRAEEKRLLMEQREQRLAEPVLAVDTPDWATEEHRYRRIDRVGVFDAEHQFLLDNQMHNRQPGYLVLTPLRIQGQPAAILVNRGWLPVGKDRAQLPGLGIEQTQVHFVGVIDKFPGVGFKLKGADIPAPGWPAVVQVVNIERLSARLGYPLAPYQVLLPPDAPAAYARDWQPASLHPETNQAYALQWFSFALATSVLFAWYGLKPRE